MAFKISFQNSGGEMDSRTVATEDETKAALLEMLEETPHLADGDKIIVTEIDD